MYSYEDYVLASDIKHHSSTVKVLVAATLITSLAVQQHREALPIFWDDSDGCLGRRCYSTYSALSICVCTATSSLISPLQEPSLLSLVNQSVPISYKLSRASTSNLSARELGISPQQVSGCRQASSVLDRHAVYAVPLPSRGEEPHAASPAQGCPRWLRFKMRAPRVLARWHFS